MDVRLQPRPLRVQGVGDVGVEDEPVGNATAPRHHEEQADAKRASPGKVAGRHREESRWYLAEALRQEVRAAERRGEVTRTMRDVALRLVPAFPGQP